jgi:hypothetical protein
VTGCFCGFLLAFQAYASAVTYVKIGHDRLLLVASSVTIHITSSYDLPIMEVMKVLLGPADQLSVQTESSSTV